jgi:hypothetical protein
MSRFDRNGGTGRSRGSLICRDAAEENHRIARQHRLSGRSPPHSVLFTYNWQVGQLSPTLRRSLFGGLADEYLSKEGFGWRGPTTRGPDSLGIVVRLRGLRGDNGGGTRVGLWRQFPAPRDAGERRSTFTTAPEHSTFMARKQYQYMEDATATRSGSSPQRGF